MELIMDENQVDERVKKFTRFNLISILIAFSTTILFLLFQENIKPLLRPYGDFVNKRWNVEDHKIIYTYLTFYIPMFLIGLPYFLAFWISNQKLKSLNVKCPSCGKFYSLNSFPSYKKNKKLKCSSCDQIDSNEFTARFRKHKAFKFIGILVFLPFVIGYAIVNTTVITLGMALLFTYLGLMPIVMIAMGWFEVIKGIEKIQKSLVAFSILVIPSTIICGMMAYILWYGLFHPVK